MMNEQVKAALASRFSAETKIQHQPAKKFLFIPYQAEGERIDFGPYQDIVEAGYAIKYKNGRYRFGIFIRSNNEHNDITYYEILLKQNGDGYWHKTPLYLREQRDTSQKVRVLVSPVKFLLEEEKDRICAISTAYIAKAPLESNDRLISQIYKDRATF